MPTQKQKQKQSQTVHIHLNESKSASKPKRKYTRKMNNTKNKGQKFNPGLDASPGGAGIMSRNALNPPIIQAPDNSATTALLASILNNSLNNSNLNNNSQINQSSILPSRNETNDRTIFKARESIIPQIPETPKIRVDTVKPTEIKTPKLLLQRQQTPNSNLIKEIKPQSTLDFLGNGLSTSKKEIKPLLLTYEPEEVNEQEEWIESHPTDTNSERYKRKMREEIEAENKEVPPRYTPEEKENMKNRLKQYEKDLKIRNLKERGVKPEAQSTLDFLFSGGSPVQKARPSTVHKTPEQKSLTYNEPKLLVHHPRQTLVTPEENEAAKKIQAAIKRSNRINELGKALKILKENQKPNVYTSAKVLQAAVRRSQTPQTMEKQFGTEMRTNKKAYQSLLSEDRTRTKQPEENINHAKAAINFYDRNIKKGKSGRPRLETNHELFSLFD